MEEQVVYDKLGRMKYNPEFHENHNKPYTTKEIAYICKNFKVMPIKTLALSVGRTENAVRNLVDRLKRDNLFDFYLKYEL